MALEIPEVNKSLPARLNPDDFGQVGYSDTDGLFVISALSSPLYIDTEFNQYALFVTNPLIINSIHWEMKYKSINDIDDGPYQTIVTLENEFVFTFDEFDFLAEEGEIIIETTVNHSSGVSLISINQRINDSYVINYLETEYIAFAGNRKVTSKLINNYRPFIISSVNQIHDYFGEARNIPQLLVSAYIANSINPFFNEICLDKEFITSESIGVCNIHPNLVDIVYENPSDNDKINLLRFPKTNILIFVNLLNNIKNRYNEYRNLNEEELIENSEAITFITQSLYNTTFPNYLNKYKALDDVLLELYEIKEKGVDNPNYSSIFKYGNRINRAMGSPWNRSFFYGKKEIRGGIYDENKAEINFRNDDQVRVDVYWEINHISQEMIESTNEDYSKDFRIRITFNGGLRVFNQPNTNTPESLEGNENIRLQRWQVFRLLEIKETTSATGDKIEWYRIQYQAGIEKWIVAFSGNRYAIFEKVVKLNFNAQVTANVNGKFNFELYDPGIYFIRTIKETRYNDGVTRDYYDGEFGWFLAGHSKSELAILMQSTEPTARWIKESEVLGRVRHFENWLYDLTYAHYPTVLNLHNNLYYENEQIPELQDADGNIIRALEPGAAPYLKTNCNTFSEAILVDSWNDNYAFGWNINNSEHNLWVNAAGLNLNERLRVIEPAIVKRMGSCIYAIEKNNANNNLNHVFNQASNPAQTTPHPIINYDQVKPKPWTLIQHFNTENGWGGHMYIIIDYELKTDKILVLEASSLNSRKPNNQNSNGPRVRGLFHVDCLIQCMLQLDDNSYLMSNVISSEWNSSAPNTWEGLKDDKKGIAMVELYIYDLQLTRPPRNTKKIL